LQLQASFLLASASAIEAFKLKPTETSNMNLAKRLIQDARQVAREHEASGAVLNNAQATAVESFLCIQVGLALNAMGGGLHCHLDAYLNNR
jgi:hypothetical protein